MENLIIRFWEDKDIESIRKLSKDLCEYDRDNFDPSLMCDWINTMNWNKFLTELLSSDESCVILAEFNNEIIGYLFWEISETLPWRNIQKQSELIEIYVDGKYRWNKIWNHLFNAFKEWSVKKWVTNIKLLVSFWNDKSINFYKNMWFTDYDISLEYNI